MNVPGVSVRTLERSIAASGGSLDSKVQVCCLSGLSL